MTNINGTWDIVIASPIGKQELSIDLTVDGTAVTGTGKNAAEVVELKDGQLTGDTVTFAADLKKPFPLTVVYELVFNGDEITGTAKAGKFPKSPVTGKRVATSTPAS